MTIESMKERLADGSCPEASLDTISTSLDRRDLRVKKRSMRRSERERFDVLRQSEDGFEDRLELDSTGRVFIDETRASFGTAPPYSRAPRASAHAPAARAATGSGRLQGIRKKERHADSGMLRLFRRQLELVGHAAEFGQRTGIHFPHRSTAMHLHRGFGDADIAGDLFAETTAHDLDHDLALSGAQRIETIPQGVQSLFILAPSAITREAELDGVEKLLIPEGLGQELDGAPLHRLHGHGDVAVARDEDDREFLVRRGELALEIQAALPRQSHVEDQAGGAVSRTRLEEIGNSREQRGLQANRSQQTSNRGSKIRIIVDDEDGGL
jgi:hypothetical protein